MQSLTMLIPMVIMIAVFYFLLIRPQNKQRKILEQKINNLSKGDKFLTQGGLFCTVVSVKDNVVIGKIGNGVKVEISKAFINNVVDGGTTSSSKSKDSDKNEDSDLDNDNIKDAEIVEETDSDNPKDDEGETSK